MKRFLLFLAPLLLFAQDPTQQLSFNFTATGNSATLFTGNNTSGVGQPSNTWEVTWYADGAAFTSAQVYIDGAPSSGTVAGAFVHISNADAIDGTTNGTNAARGRIVVRSYYPYIRVNLAGVTGSGGYVRGQLLGYKGTSTALPAAITATFTPSGTQDVNLVQVAGNAVLTAGVNGSQSVGGVAAAGATTALGNPEQVAGIDPTGALRRLTTDPAGDQFQVCNNSAQILQTFTAVTTSGAQRIITGTASQKIRLCKFIFSTGTPEDLTILQGTGSDCSGGTTGTNAKFYSVTAVALDLDGGFTQSATGQDFCINPSVSQNAGLTVVYVKY